MLKLDIIDTIKVQGYSIDYEYTPVVFVNSDHTLKEYLNDGYIKLKISNSDIYKKNYIGYLKRPLDTMICSSIISSNKTLWGIVIDTSFKGKIEKKSIIEIYK